MLCAANAALASSTEATLDDLKKCASVSRLTGQESEPSSPLEGPGRQSAGHERGVPEAVAEFDLAKVNHVRRLIRAGKYRVDSAGVADRILLEALISTVHERLVRFTPAAAVHAAAS